MRLSDLPPAEQKHFLDGITVGIATREAGRLASDRDQLDPYQGDDVDGGGGAGSMLALTAVTRTRSLLHSGVNGTDARHDVVDAKVPIISVSDN